MKRTSLALALFALASLLLAACSVNTATPAPTPAAKASGNLVNVHIESAPSGAEIWIDGEFVGSTNLTYAVAAGKRVIEIRRAAYESWRRELTVRENTPTRIRADLIPIR